MKIEGGDVVIGNNTEVYKGLKKGRIIKSRLIDGIVNYKIDFGNINEWLIEDEFTLDKPKQKYKKKTTKSTRKDKTATSRDDAIRMEAEEDS